MLKDRERLDAIAYGLRNLIVLDDEQTRIEDQLDDVDGDAKELVKSLINNRHYSSAYIVAIVAWARWLDLQEINAGIEAWLLEWNSQLEEPEFENAKEFVELAMTLLC